MIELDIQSLYRMAFNMPGTPLTIPQASGFNEPAMPDINQIGRKAKTKLLYDNRLSRQNLIGVPLFMPCMIGGYQLPNEPIITVRLKKKIVETPLYGSKRKGTVKEIISTEDYMLSIKGVAVNHDDNYNYPADQVEALNRLFAKNRALEIVSPLTDLLGIDYVVLTAFELPEMIGVQHAQAYRFAAISDEDFILEEM